MRYSKKTWVGVHYVLLIPKSGGPEFRAGVPKSGGPEFRAGVPKSGGVEF